MCVLVPLKVIPSQSSMGRETGFNPVGYEFQISVCGSLASIIFLRLVGQLQRLWACQPQICVLVCSQTRNIVKVLVPLRCCMFLVAATNFEEDPESAMGEANDDNALMRFEFLEALTRVAMLKYGKDQGLNDISDSVQMMMSECFAPSLISPSMPRELAIHPNVLRRRLYTEVSIFLAMPMSKPSFDIDTNCYFFRKLPRSSDLDSFLV